MAKIHSIMSILLRAVAAVAAIAAAIVMATAHDTAEVLTLKFEAKYTNAPTFKYFVIVNSIVSCYSVIVLFLPYKVMLWRLILLLDTVVTVVLASGFSAAMAIAYVGKKGNSSAGWLPICGQVPKFCNGAMGGLVSGFIAMVVYLLLVLYSLHGAVSPLLCFNE